MAFLFSPFEWVSKICIFINGMSKVDQKQAVRNVAYSADATWTSAFCPFQKANMDLYLATCNIKLRTTKWFPRTVRDSIPNSKLAQYSNYEYHEARELSYTPMVLKYERLFETFPEGQVKEPWMLQDIDDLLAGFLSYSDQEDCSSDNLSGPNNDSTYESPFLEAETFDEMALKLRITSKSVKNIWDTQYFPYYGWRPEPKTSSLVLFKSPALQMFSSIKREDAEMSEWFHCGENLEQIKSLSKSIKEQNSWIYKQQATIQSWLDPPPLTHRRLYSAVLQGAAPSDQPCAGKRREIDSPGSSSVNPLLRLPCPYYVASRHATPLAGVYATTPGYHHQYIPVYPTSNFIPNTSLLNLRQTNYFPLMLQNATAPYINFHQSFSSYRTVMLPPRPQMVVPSGGWFLPPSQVKINLLPPTQPPSVAQVRASKPSAVIRDSATVNQELENIAIKTVNAVLDEPESFVPVTGVSSDELELQALEQYNGASSTSVFQELERQAAEQYNTSENWIDPPKHTDDDSFGGCSKRPSTLRLGAWIMV